jgi:hypothetical protein
MTKLTTRRPTRDATFPELVHDLTEIAGQLMCGFPPLSWMKPGSFGSGTCGSCGGAGCVDCGGVDLRRDPCGPCGDACGGAGGCDCGSCAQCGGVGCGSCGGAGLASSLPCFSGGEKPCYPCWMPRQLAPICESVCPGSALRIHFCLTNLSLQSQPFLVAATGAGAKYAAGDPSTVTIEPMDRGELTAVIKVPASAEGECIQLLIWVRGCSDHMVPVTIVADGERCGLTLTRHIVEEPDTCHTYRDHFYVHRPCGDQRSQIPGRVRTADGG